MSNSFKPNKSNLYISKLPEKKDEAISPFIDKGEFLPYRPRINRVYYIENFEYIRNYNNEPIAIGKGGYGKIYLAKNTKDNKEYAIKYISKEKMKSVGVDGSVIQREIDVHIRITHPRIIKLYSFLEDKYNYYLAMEYAPKGNLYQYIQSKKGISEKEAFKYFIQVSSAIYFLHKHGYIHRDIKPENILIDNNFDIKLCDFGWCVSIEKGERTTFCGTYEYMAPEMVNDECYDMVIDIWSLGVLLYEMIHGYSPFRAHSNLIQDPKSAQVEIFINIKNNNYTIDKDISDECVDLINKLLTTDTKKRIKIKDLFTHPWVVNKEKEFFPLYNKLSIKENNNINIIKNNNNINININSEKKNKVESKIEILKPNTNKSYNFIYSKINNNNIDKNNKIENKYLKQNKNEFEDKNKKIETEINQDDIGIIMKPRKRELKPKEEHKESYLKNNFYNMTSKKNKNILPRVNRVQKDNTRKNSQNISSLKPLETQAIKNINNNNTKLREKANYLRAKSEQRSLIRVKKPELDDYFKKQKEINDLNMKIKHIKEKREIILNTLREYEYKNKRQKSIRKIYESLKSNSSYDFSKNVSLRNKINYTNIEPENNNNKINTEKKKDLSMRRLYDKKYINLKDNRSKSFQYLLTENTNERKLNSLANDIKLKPQQRNLSKINLWNDISLYRNNANQNKENILPNDKLKRFRKRVIHISKRNNININPIKNNGIKENNNNNPFTSYKHFGNYINTSSKINTNPKNNLKENKSIQNIFYNTYYNCLFDKKYNNTNSNDIYINNSNNNILKNKYSFLKRNKEYKSVSSEKNLFNHKKIFEI